MSNLPISINARQRCIIYALLNANEHLTLQKLSKQTSLTPRIIRYNLDIARAWFRKEGVTLISRPGYGIELDATRQVRKKLLAQISQADDSNLILTRGQRQRITLFALLTSETPITYQDLAANEGISRSTIIHDVSDMQHWLNIYHLELKRTPNKGAYITGSEFSRRYALLNLIREELGERKWYSLWFDPSLHAILDKSLPPNLESYLKNLPLDFCRTAVRHIENMMGGRMPLYSRVEILMYMAVTIDALSTIGPRSLEQDFGEVRTTLENQVGRFFFSEIKRKFDIETAEIESLLLAVCLLGAKWEEDDRSGWSGGAPDPRYLGEEAIAYANEIVRICSSQLHPLLRVDQELIMGLARHLKPVLQRIRYNLPIFNENMKDIQHTYPEVFRCVQASTWMIEKDLNRQVPPEENGFIAMYIAAALNRLRTRDRQNHKVVIIGDGVRAKSIFLKSQIEFEFPTLEVFGMTSGYATDEKLIREADLALSLIPNETFAVPTLFVSPFLTTTEKRIIQNWIAEKEEALNKIVARVPDSPNLVDLLLPQNIIYAPQARDWKHAVSLASQPLIESGKILPQYRNAMIQVIEDYGPYMQLASGTILLHARPVDGVNQLCLSLLLLEQGIPFDDQSGPIDVAFVLGATDDHSHINALLQLNNLLEQEDFLVALRNAHHPADVLRAAWMFSTGAPAAS